MSYESSILGVVFAILGLTAVALSVGNARNLRRVISARSPATAEPGSVVVAEGKLEREGEAVTAPLSGDRCVGYVLARQLYYSRHARFTRSWNTSGVWDAIPSFGVRGRQHVRVRRTRESRDSTSSRVRAAPGERFSDLHLERTELSARYEPDESPPSGVSAVIDDSYDADNPHRYAEWRLDTDDSVTVVGELAETIPPTITDDGSVFALSTGSVRSILFGFLTRTVLYLLFGLGLLAGAAVEFSTEFV
ncbi:MAG: hypothetical protein ACOC2A_01165 [Halanaeroarchaeum sp.]